MRILFSAAAAALAVAAASPAAAIINAPVAANAYVTFGGLDWAWASPCAPGPGYGNGSTCGAIDLSYQSTQGWRVAVAADFASGMDYTKFQFVGANVPANGTDPVTGANFSGSNSVATACASAWFATYGLNCDFNDGAILAVFNMPGSPYVGNPAVETWVVRDASGAVPEPASWAMLIAGFGLVGAAMRRRAAAIA